LATYSVNGRKTRLQLKWEANAKLDLYKAISRPAILQLAFCRSRSCSTLPATLNAATPGRVCH